ncbi:DUF397 domain-containing protein [Streptomyces sp. NPDC006997]|uniref:DUF397 domain-containing protein n=1 Tax=Streptomyces sp. NPDC006997 TaxID=3155356 RepID=UPI00340B74B7
MSTQRWTKSTYSGDSSNCVEIGRAPAAIRIRDSKQAEGPHLTMALCSWAPFIQALPEVGEPTPH